MPKIRRAAVASGAAGIALGLLATPVAACPDPHTVRTKGPTHTYAKAYKKVRTVVVTRTAHGRTVVRLKVTGMPKSAKGKRFGAHVHRGKCGPKPSDAGPHYQNPAARPGTPLHAKEIWLDFKVDRKGRGMSKAVVPWKLGKSAVRSVIVHAKPTDPKTGDAGSRLFCTNAPFRS